MSDTKKHVFLKDYTRAIREGDAALFVGAGISRAAGYVDWKQLLREVADELELSVDRETDLVALAQFHVNERGGRDRLNQVLIDEFLEAAELTRSHQLIATLPIPTVWTTNYDDLLEKAFDATSKRYDVKRRTEDFAATRKRTDVTIYKMHGDKTDAAKAVLTKEDYETYDQERELFTIALKGDLAKKTFLFLGVSFTDPNVMYVLSRVRQLLEQNSRKHYCILKEPKPAEFADAKEGAYQCKRFAHWLKDLHRYNIQPVLIGDYQDVPSILEELNRRSHLRDVFISGSAADFSPLGQEEFQELCRSLGAELIKKGFNLISGFGLGVGDAVIVGAMQSLPRNDDERLQLWPFPQEVPAGTDRAAMWQSYRDRMISNAGVVIVLAGNKKLPDGTIVRADGVYKEAAIARAQGKPIIPIGATGHVARELWEACVANPSTYFGHADISKQLDVLGNDKSAVADIVQAVVESLRQLDK